MKFHFLTIFPELIQSYLEEAMLKRAHDKKLADFEVVNVRDHSKDKHHKTDHKPYGGGPGMVMTAEPILNAFSKLKIKKGITKLHSVKKIKVVMLSPSGKMFSNTIAAKMAKQYSNVVFICGRYEGVDDRVRKILKASEYSIGDYVLTGGELPALVMTDAIVRQILGVLGDSMSLEEARIASPRTYTRPEILEWPKAEKGKVSKKYKVPPVLLSGHQKNIEEWRKGQKK